jgi:anaerobic selenocysteine-containing dehydrogenase
MPADVAAELANALADEGGPGAFPFRLVSRRIREVMNTVGMNWPQSRERVPYNPAFLHPDSIAAAGLAVGDRIAIVSDHGRIEAIVAADPTIRTETVSMSHCWGGLPGEDAPYERFGANTSLLVSLGRDCETINGMPRMSAIPVRIERADAEPAATPILHEEAFPA